jgi:hypothetical protein
MDIKRKLSPHLGEDLRIRIFFGETQSVMVSAASPPGSPSPLPYHAPSKSKSSALVSGIEVKEQAEGRSVELVATNRGNGSKYQEVPRKEEL